MNDNTEIGGNMTFSAILKRMLGRVPDDTDKREGSIVYDALAPAALEIARAAGRIGMFADEGFADTASREFLLKRAAERGLTPYPASNAVRRGEFDVPVPIGARFSAGGINYTVTEAIKGEANAYRMVCEISGGAGNRESGAMLPVDYINGLTSAELTDVLIPGEDEEDTEHFRSRYFADLEAQAFCGNVRDYADKVNEIAGVGGVKVYPAWQTGVPGSVKLAVIGSDYNAPNQTLIDSVRERIGEIAPIGHTVTVAGAANYTVNVYFKPTLQSGWNYEAARPAVKAAVSEYFRELARDWDKSDTLIVRISRVESRILDLAGIIDVSGVKLNGSAQNLTVPKDSIPVIGEVTADVN